MPSLAIPSYLLLFTLQLEKSWVRFLSDVQRNTLMPSDQPISTQVISMTREELDSGNRRK